MASATTLALVNSTFVDTSTALPNATYVDPWYVNNHTPLVIALETMLYIVLATVISCSSIIVILVVWRTSALHTPPGFLMIIMSICDLLLSTILAMSTVNVIQRKSVFPTYVNVVLAVMFATFQNGNAMALMVSAIDQLISILKPLQYPSISTPKRILTVFISMLAFSVLFVIFLVFMAYKYTVEQEKKGETGTSLLYYDDLTHLQFVACYEKMTQHMAMSFFMIPGAVVLVCYGIIFTVVVRQRQEIRRMQTQQAAMSSRRGSTGGGMQILSHIKACQMLFIVTLVYFLGFLPYMLMDRYINSQLDKERPQLPPLWMYKLFTWLIIVQSLLNCAIFYKMNKNFKLGLQLLRQLPITKRLFSNLRSDGTTMMTTCNGHFPSFSNSQRHQSLLGVGGTPRPSVQMGTTATGAPNLNDEINPRSITNC
ncbi:trace amine-associated receptor 7c-like isoform X2 [Convolutriloba macropyga]|uniref:trace amine-associated receptor 7c-like isoform X2 n=1 Tax=Convolutriloba macropyga TaxID=536237 RepID=UPI003F51F53F